MLSTTSLALRIFSPDGIRICDRVDGLGQENRGIRQYHGEHHPHDQRDKQAHIGTFRQNGREQAERGDAGHEQSTGEKKSGYLEQDDGGEGNGPGKKNHDQAQAYSRKHDGQGRGNRGDVFAGQDNSP